MNLRLGTRGSQLARYQANSVAALLHERAGIDTEIVIIRTSGDRLAEAALSEIGGKRLFVKEIEDALLAGEVDIAVHSSKDMPAVLPDGLEVGAVLPRADPRDAIVLPQREGDADQRQASAAPLPIEEIVRELGRAPRIGTSSVRRSAQLTRLFPGARFLPIRGNLDTRLRKLDFGEFGAIVLAAAGLTRLEHAARISAYLPADVCVPAPGQGIIAVEIRSGDARTRDAVAQINDRPSGAALIAERAVVRRLGGGCQMPIGAFAQIDGESLRATGIVISIDGDRAERADAVGSVADADAIGVRVAEQLLAQGAGAILDAVQREHASVEGLQP
jgi:hydroxymethylbilane synthase